MTEPRHQSEARMSRFIGEPLAGVAVLPPGLEEEGAAELKALGATSVQVLRRAVAFRTDLEGFYRLQLQARLPFRILRELARFSCDGPRQLYEAVAGAAGTKGTTMAGAPRSSLHRSRPSTAGGEAAKRRSRKRKSPGGAFS